MKGDQLMLFMEKTDIYYKNHTKHTRILCGKIQMFLMLQDTVHIVTTGL
jgi:hypothetical protein